MHTKGAKQTPTEACMRLARASNDVRDRSATTDGVAHRGIGNLIRKLETWVGLRVNLTNGMSGFRV